MYKWFTLQSPSVETLYGLCQENMNMEHKGGRAEMMWACPLAGRETAHTGQPGQPTSARAHACLTCVSEPGCEKLRVVFKGFLSHCLGDKKTQSHRI